MRYINRLFTYLLTYLLTYRSSLYPASSSHSNRGSSQSLLTKLHCEAKKLRRYDGTDDRSVYAKKSVMPKTQPGPAGTYVAKKRL